MADLNSIYPPDLLRPFRQHDPREALALLQAHIERHKVAGSTYTLQLILLSLGGYDHHFKTPAQLNRIRSLDDNLQALLGVVMFGLRHLDDHELLAAVGGEEVLRRLKEADRG